jgi:O-acetylserine/cysteine efflux transporter
MARRHQLERSIMTSSTRDPARDIGRSAARPVWGDALALFTVAAWGATFPFSKPIVAAVEPSVFATARFWLIGLGLLAIARLAGETTHIPRSRWPVLIGLGALFGALQTIWVFALALTSASKGAVIMAVSPAFGALIGRALGERASPTLWLGILVAFAGVFLVINNSLTALQLGGAIVGDLVFLASAALWAAYNAAIARASLTGGAMKIGAYVTLIGCAFMTVPAWYGARHGAVLPDDALLWVNFAFVVVISGILAFAAWYSAIARMGATRAMLYMYLVPVFAVAGAVVFLGESFSAIQAAGGALALAGVALARRTTPPPVAAEQPAAAAE